jgi:hypothetical protein
VRTEVTLPLLDSLTCIYYRRVSQAKPGVLNLSIILHRIRDSWCVAKFGTLLLVWKFLSFFSLLLSCLWLGSIDRVGRFFPRSSKMSYYPLGPLTRSTTYMYLRGLSLLSQGLGCSAVISRLLCFLAGSALLPFLDSSYWSF